ncbi:MAG: hypothetical protein ACTSWP_01360 [Candidatus Freyarchaeota archaeon]|nr:hypothetical protein [Candidatus Freyrarchaeum guaymaensis]
MADFGLGRPEKPVRIPPATPRKIKDLSRSDGRVRIMGVVVESSSNHVVIDDGTGMVMINLASSTPPPSTGKYVRVFGLVTSDEKGGLYVNAEILQDMSSLDLDLYKRVRRVIESER